MRHLLACHSERILPDHTAVILNDAYPGGLHRSFAKEAQDDRLPLILTEERVVNEVPS